MCWYNSQNAIEPYTNLSLFWINIAENQNLNLTLDPYDCIGADFRSRKIDGQQWP